MQVENSWRKNIHRALEGSLRRLKTDYADLYWLHAYDGVTPVEEVISTMNDLVRAGKIRHYGFSDTPAWYVARAQTLAECEATEPLIALQLEYSLVERTIEREHVPAAQELGLAICPWSPLAGGFLSGKYKREASGHKGKGQGRLTTPGGSPFNRFSERNWRVHDALMDVAKQMGKPTAQVALNWVATQPGITSTIVGATKVTQLDDNLVAIDFSQFLLTCESGLMKRVRWSRRSLTFSSAAKFGRRIAGRAGASVDAGAYVQCAGEGRCEGERKRSSSLGARCDQEARTDFCR